MKHEERPTGRDPRYEGALADLLREIDGMPWGGYRRLVGRHEVGEFTLIVDRVPPDPFAGPARMRLVLGRRDARIAAALTSDRVGRTAVEDRIARDALDALSTIEGEGSGSGHVALQPLSSSMIERSACRVGDEEIELRLLVELPASARRVRGRQAAELLCRQLPRLGLATLVVSSRRAARIESAVRSARDHAAMQASLRPRGLVAFLAEGSSLARSGAGEAPRRDGTERPLVVPDALAVTLDDAAGEPVRGLGIPAGVTVIVGGAFHGKSTLLDAIAHGTRPKCDGDGRERVVTEAGAVAVRAEDGRALNGVDLRGWFDSLPGGPDLARMKSDRASGSTSQAAALVEALEAGSKLLLIDEDRAATNFMIRDERMQRLVPRPDESVIPFIDRVRELYERFGVSTVMITGGAGDYLDVADTVIQLRAFQPVDRGADARRIVSETLSGRARERFAALELPARRRLDAADVPAPRTAARGDRALRVGEETLELANLQQLVERGETLAIGALLRLALRLAPDSADVETLLDRIERALDEEGLDGIAGGAVADLSRPRRYEIAAALHRWRAARFTDAD